MKVLNDDSMEKAFVLINAEMGAEIIDELKSIPEVKEVYGVYVSTIILLVLKLLAPTSLRTL